MLDVSSTRVTSSLAANLGQWAYTVGYHSGQLSKLRFTYPIAARGGRYSPYTRDHSLARGRYARCKRIKRYCRQGSGLNLHTVTAARYMTLSFMHTQISRGGMLILGNTATYQYHNDYSCVCRPSAVKPIALETTNTRRACGSYAYTHAKRTHAKQDINR